MMGLRKLLQGWMTGAGATLNETREILKEQQQRHVRQRHVLRRQLNKVVKQRNDLIHKLQADTEAFRDACATLKRDYEEHLKQLSEQHDAEQDRLGAEIDHLEEDMTFRIEEIELHDGNLR